MMHWAVVWLSRLEYERVHGNLLKLKLNAMESLLDNTLELASRDGRSTLESLDFLLEEERKAKESRLVDTRMKFAGFPQRKTLEDFDFDFQPSIEKTLVNDLAGLRFLHNAENVVFLGPPGVGKSHLAIALGMEAIRKGFPVHFVNAGTLMERLVQAEREGKLEYKIRGYLKFKLLIVDEIGYLPFSSEAAHSFFQLISRRYEKSSTIFTSNKSFGEWGEIFNDSVIASAVLDRVLHHCTTVNIRGESYRLKERRKQGLVPRQ
jgi:DNA replication protein DnaC